MGVLVKNADFLLTQDRSRAVLRGVDLLTEGRSIVSIGKNIRERPEHVIDGRHKLVMPGLVNTHGHLAMTLFRGFGDDLQLGEWLAKRIWPAEKKLKGEHVRAGTSLAALESIRAGTTTVTDMYFFMDKAAAALGTAGLRAELSYGMIDLGDPAKGKKELAIGERFVRDNNGRSGGRIRASLGPHAPNTCSEELLLKTAATAKKLGCKIQIHVSETRGEVFDVMKKTGKRPVDYLASLGFLSPAVIAAHCCWLTKREVGLLASAGASVSHCPASNMKLASGGATPIPEMLAAGVTVSLGTDGAASNNSLSVFGEMKLAALLQKHSRWDARLVPAQTALDFATLGGAGALGIPAGELKPGKLADLILVDLKSPSMVPMRSAVSNLVYSGPHLVTDSVINGEPIMLDRKVITLDEEEVMLKAEKASADLAS